MHGEPKLLALLSPKTPVSFSSCMQCRQEQSPFVLCNFVPRLIDTYWIRPSVAPDCLPTLQAIGVQSRLQLFG